MTVWILDDSPIYGGAERFALRLASWLAGEDRPVRIVCPADSELARRASDAGLDVAAAAMPPVGWRYPGAVPGVRHALAGAAPGDLLVANSARAQAYAVPAWRLLRHRPPLVHVMHEQDSARRQSARFVLARHGGVAAVGATSTSTYRAALGDTPVAEVHNVLGADELARAIAGRTTPPSAASAPPVVGTLSRMAPGKGMAELVDELAAEPDAWSRARLAAPFQEPAITEQVRARIAAHALQERVELLGEIHDVGGFLTGIDVLVVPSTGTEGQPTAILEALAHGRPVVLRRALYTADWDGLPVAPYATPGELAGALRERPVEPVAAAALTDRFSPAHAFAVLQATARR